jgi:hypothetical protein
MKQMEKNNEQPWNYSFSFTQSWPKKDWTADWLSHGELTEMALMYQDLLEHDVETSGNQDAKTMLSNIGINC